MEVKTSVIDLANASATAQISSQMLKENVEKLAKKASKNLKIDGFRAGKVPLAVVLKRYGKELENDAKQDAFGEIVRAALVKLEKKEDELIGQPIISKFDEKDGNIDVELEISFKPKLNLEGYESLVPEFSNPRVTKKEIESKVEEFLKMSAPVEPSNKTSLEKGDFAKFDFEGFVGGVAFDGGKAENYELEIGSGQFIPGFEDGMIGLKVGEERDVKVTFPEQYGASNLAGKDAVFKVKLHQILEKKIPEKLDDEMVAKFMPGEEASVENFEARIKDQIRAEKLNKLITEELKPKFAEILVENFKFDLPKNIVEQEIDVQFRNAWNSFSPEDMEKFRTDKDALTKQREGYREEAQKSVRLTFIIDELARLRNISATDQELLQTIYFEAYRYGVDPKVHLENYKKQGVLPAIKMAIIEEKLFNDLFKKDDKKGE